MDPKLYISMFFSVIIIVVFVVIIYYGGKWMTKKYALDKGNRQMKIIDKVMLGQDKSLVIAEIINCKYIIGISGQQITLIKDLGEIDLPDIKPTGQDDFAAIFSGMLKKQVMDVKDRFINRGGKE